MAQNENKPHVSFESQLILFRFFLHELQLNSLQELSDIMGSKKYEGISNNGTTFYFQYLASHCQLHNAAIDIDQLFLYDKNILRHTKRISQKRGTIHWKYFQYIALLFTEMYLDRYFTNRDIFCFQLNNWLQKISVQSQDRIQITPYTTNQMNKLALMCATGGGKTLLMHINILQFIHYFQHTNQYSNRSSLNKIILLVPNEGMGRQHLQELTLSSIPASPFNKDESSEGVVVIDINKLREDGKVKTVSVDSFESNNLVLVDEGHRGLSGNIWYDFRTRISADGFSFEYSATFKQALKSGSRRLEAHTLMEEYKKSILMDYSYKYFYEDGYGKDYHIYNLRSNFDEEQRRLYLTGCLLTFYLQLKVYDTQKTQMQGFQIENPLLVFVGNRVTASVSSRELTDIGEVLDFLDKFLCCSQDSIRRIRCILSNDTGLVDENGCELFSQHFSLLSDFFCDKPDPESVYSDVLHLVFNMNPIAHKSGLVVENLCQVPGEIALRAGIFGEYFGVISIGDSSGLIKLCARNNIKTKTQEFVSQSLFHNINRSDSNIKVLIGSRKFAEGWNSWRVSTMGLINFARREGAQAIQMFGRGVRLKGYHGGLKRSRKLDLPPATIPPNIEILETLNIFGVRAQYMEEFKQYLSLEHIPVDGQIQKDKQNKDLKTKAALTKSENSLNLQHRYDFIVHSRRFLLDAPDPDFYRYLLQNRIVIDFQNPVQTIGLASVMPKNLSVNEQRFPDVILPILDYYKIVDELVQYKKEKGYFNIIIQPKCLANILCVNGWYGLIIPQDMLAFDSINKLGVLTNYAVLLLKSYLDAFFRFEERRWKPTEYT